MISPKERIEILKEEAKNKEAEFHKGKRLEKRVIKRRAIQEREAINEGLGDSSNN